MSAASPPIEQLEWDTAFFGFGVGRVTARRLTEEQATACAHRARAFGLRCLYFLAEPDDVETWRAAARAGFDLIDVRVELDRDLTPASSGPSAPSAASDGSRATEADLPELLELARGSFKHSRFFRDARFPADKAEALFSAWARGGIGAADSFAFLHRAEGRLVGFVSARLASPGTGRIELVAVSPAFQGKGIGLRLLDQTAAELASRGATSVTVVTQVSQTAALRLYERAGFRTRSVGFWFHGWF